MTPQGDGADPSDGADPGDGAGPQSGAGARESPGLQDGVGEPDGFARLWTPHRLAYVSSGENENGGCPFCRIPTLEDRQGLIVARGELNFVVLNLYPYNPGHLMVVPYRHIADYSDLTDAELTEFSALTRRALTVIRGVSNPHGFNIGINAGAAAGAGIAPHLHQHVVPRWSGDANFMPVVAQTKVLPELLPTTRDRLSEAW